MGPKTTRRVGEGQCPNLSDSFYLQLGEVLYLWGIFILKCMQEKTRALHLDQADG